MAKRKMYSSEKIVMKLREAEVMLSQGKNTKEACRALGAACTGCTPVGLTL